MSTSFSKFRTLAICATAAAALIGSLSSAQAYDRGCRGQGDQALGAIAGAVIGGVIGGQFGNDGDDRAIGAVAGALLGGAAGASAANQSDCNDRYATRSYDAYQPAYERAPVYRDNRYGYRDDFYNETFETVDPYERVAFDDPHYGRGYVEPEGWYRDKRGRTCRSYTQTIRVDGRRQTAEGTACRNRDGTWRIVE
jgi:surface antigen